jgi:hypothetical protein
MQRKINLTGKNGKRLGTITVTKKPQPVRPVPTTPQNLPSRVVSKNGVKRIIQYG